MQTFEANHSVGEIVTFIGMTRAGELNGQKSLRKISAIRVEQVDPELYNVSYQLENSRGWWPESRFEKIESEESAEPAAE
jgi:hypothetical protein